MVPARPARAALVLAAVAVAALARARAVRELPPDYDELDYVPLGFEYAKAWDAAGLRGLASVTRNDEHPGLVKVVNGVAVRVAHAPEPPSHLDVGRPMPAAARPAFEAARRPQAVAGVAQVLLVGAVAPLGGLWLAVDTYHVKYTSQAYLEAIPGLLAVIAVLLFERATRRGRGRDVAAAPLLLSAAALGLSAAGKYPYPAVAGLALAPFLVKRVRPRLVLLYAAVALAAFWAGDPALWIDPGRRLWESLAYHWRYSSGEHVRRAGLPWWMPFHWLTRPAPAEWHPGVFRISFPDYGLLAAAVASAGAALRRRPVWVAWAAVGLAFLLVWPTKWPQYTLLVRTPLAAIAGIGLGAAWDRAVGRVRRPRAATG